MNYKEGVCIDCKNISKLIAKRCQYCYWKYRALIKKPGEKTVQKKKNLNVFFAEQALVFSHFCDNCGSKLDRSSIFARRSQTCHILPKSIFETVATHPQNKVFMCCYGGCYGHSLYDNSNAKKRKSMPVYELAVERFRTFENELTLPEKIRAYKYLGLDTSEIK